MHFQNVIEICIRGEETERFLNMCSYHNIRLWDICRENEDCFAMLSARDFFALKDMVRKSGVNVKIVKKEGISFWLQKRKKRKVFFGTAFVCLLCLWLGSYFLWGIQITGNHTITQDQIESFLQEQGIHYGMPLSQISMDVLKKEIRSTYEDITWVSIYLKGTRLMISLKEKDTVTPEKEETGGCDLVAQEAGTVDSILVRQGTAGVTAGQEVEKGEILIAGRLEIPAEDGTIQEVKSCKAEGDVWLRYTIPVARQQSLEYLTREYTGKEIERTEFAVCDKRLELTFLDIPYSKYDLVTETLDIPIFKIFSLPLEVSRKRYREYQVKKERYSYEEAKKLLQESLDKIILSLEEKGVQIIEKNVRIETSDISLSLTGELTVRSLCTQIKASEETQ